MEQDMDIALPSIPMELPLGGRIRFEQAWRSVHADLGRRARRLTRGDYDRAEELLSRTALKAFLYRRIQRVSATTGCLEKGGEMR